MELRAAIHSLEKLTEPCAVELYSDSQYLVKALNERWLDGWRRRGWKTADKKPVKNRDLWERLAKAADPHQIRIHWVKGHAGDSGNERCDELANLAVANGPLLEDDGFESRTA